MTQILFTVLFAILLDRLLPDRAGLVVTNWYNDWIESIEQRFNGGTRTHGIAAVIVAMVPIVLGILLARFILGEIGRWLAFAFDVIVLYLCVELDRLGRSAHAVAEGLDEGNVVGANQALMGLTGKPAPQLTESDIARESIGAILKQGNWLVVAPIFWFLFLGPAGAAIQRLAASLDRMWGHRDSRYMQFGWAAARVNDLLGWIPARITALSYAIMGSFEDALHCWRRQARMWSDINSGPLLASGFGAMHMNDCEARDDVEDMDAAQITANSGDVRRAMALLWRVLLFWLAVAILMAGAHLFGIFFPD